MAIYQYKCEKCGKTFEISANFGTDLGLHPECPFCKYPITKRVFSAPAVIYKGNGFYVTDNKKKKEENEHNRK
jgi:putative FmdB family regulatory protein